VAAAGIFLVVSELVAVSAADFHAVGTSSIEQLYRTWAPAVRRWSAHLGGSGIDADDIVQQVFIQVQRRLDSLQDPGLLKAWLFRVTQNEVRQARRRERWRRFLGQSEVPVEEAPVAGPSEVERFHATQTVRKVMERLSEKDRTLLALFELEGMSGAEISQLTGAKESAVWVQLHRARARFLKELEALEGGQR
jgi:RNA polymerase sigma-70 factor (ECF subfamily)